MCASLPEVPIPTLDYWLGSHRYLEEHREETPDVHDRLQQLAAGGQSVVVIGNERRVIGMITLADAIRAESAWTVEELRQAGVEHIVIRTGDNRPTAEAIAKAASVQERAKPWSFKRLSFLGQGEMLELALVNRACRLPALDAPKILFNRQRVQEPVDFPIVQTAPRVSELPFSPPPMLDDEVPVAEAPVMKDQ